MSKTGEQFAPYGSADYLVDIEQAAAYLEAALEEADDDPAYIAQAFGTIARSGNVSELARRVGMSREGLHKALSPRATRASPRSSRSPKRSASSFTSSRRPDPDGARRG